jgi:DNA-binding LacI/PurR family transcriptional regulator
LPSSSRRAASQLGVVDQDDPMAMEAIVGHLYEFGHRRLAFVSYRLRERSGTRRRCTFQSALARRGLASAGVEGGASAVVAHNDMLAIAMIDRLERSGLRVPVMSR